MGLFDVFSKGGKYFGKAIEPRCEYCEFGKRSKDGDKMLCNKKGLVDMSYHCPKFIYSPLKRIPAKQLKRVGWLEGDYDEKDEEEVEKTEAKSAANKKGANAKPVPAKKEEPAKPVEAAPAKKEPAAEPVKAEIPVPEAPKPAPAAPKPAPAAPKPAASTLNDLAALAAAAEAAGDYNPEAPAAEEDPAVSTGLTDM